MEKQRYFGTSAGKPRVISAFLACVFAMALTGPVEAAQAAAKYTDKGELMMPRNYRQWVFVGAPVTPNDMNNGKAAFPEFHHVYIDPASFAAYKKTGKFPNGTVLVKELAGVGAKSSASGNGYFAESLSGLRLLSRMPNASPKNLATGPISVSWGMAARRWQPPPAMPATSRMQPKTWSLPSTTRYYVQPSRPSKRGLRETLPYKKAANRPPLLFQEHLRSNVFRPLFQLRKYCLDKWIRDGESRFQVLDRRKNQNLHSSTLCRPHHYPSRSTVPVLWSSACPEACGLVQTDNSFSWLGTPN